MTGKTLAVYGDPRENPDPVDTVLLTHHRRDVVWAGRTLVSLGAKAVVPAAEVAEFSDVGEFWSSFAQQRFHDYSHKSTKVLAEPMPVWKTVQGGETLTWEGLPIRVLDTPGYTRWSSHVPDGTRRAADRFHWRPVVSGTERSWICTVSRMPSLI